MKTTHITTHELSREEVVSILTKHFNVNSANVEFYVEKEGDDYNETLIFSGLKIEIPCDPKIMNELNYNIQNVSQALRDIIVDHYQIHVLNKDGFSINFGGKEFVIRLEERKD